MHKHVGTEGTFATWLVTGAANGVRDVPIPDPVIGVYPGGADAQNAVVKSYFVTAGLPEKQIASISADGTVYLHGPYVLEGSYTLLHRGWEGVPIDDSIASAFLDAKGRSASEQVYWPEIPGEILAQARAFQKLLADPAQKAAYVAKLPASSRVANLVIHHTSWFWQGSFQAQACCRGANTVDPCFDISGHLVRLPGDDGSSDGGVVDADAGSEIVCPISDSGRFSELPSGTCEGVGSCAIELQSVCRFPGDFVPVYPPVFDCQCVLNQWQCAVTGGGGMGLIPCGDAGDAGASASADQ